MSKEVNEERGVVAHYIRMSLPGLPYELLTMIFACLPKSDLKSIRLVSRIWDDLAIKRLFDVIYFLARSRDYDAFISWTMNERCRQAVKHLKYDTLLVNEQYSWEEYRWLFCAAIE